MNKKYKFHKKKRKKSKLKSRLRDFKDYLKDNFSKLALVVFWIGFCFILEALNEHTDYFKSEKFRSADVKTRVIPGGMLPNFGGDYMVRQFYIDTDYFQKWEFYDVTLATQCSANHLHHVVMQIERWTGPISVAVFAPDEQASFATDAILSMGECWPEIKKRVTFHLVYPTNHIADLSDSVGFIEHEGCDDLLNKISSYGSDATANYASDIPYPHNVARNAARRGVATEFVFLVDIDVMPSIGMRDDFLDFAKRNSVFENPLYDRSVFVIPCFELQYGLECPNDKTELKKKADEGIIRPFHNATCFGCHSPEEHPRWLMLPKSPVTSVSFNATWVKNWEPFYISRRNVPMFDERFKQYGFDRQEQICELRVAGYTFSVLNNHFLVHDGWKEAHASARLMETYRNWVLFNFHFQQTLLKMYPEPESCSPIETWRPKGRYAQSNVQHKKIKFQRKYASDLL